MGQAPSRDIFATVVLTSWSCADHLTGTAILLQAKRCIPSLFTLARGAPKPPSRRAICAKRE